MSAVSTIDDPRPIAAESPYTFFLPSPEELAALAPGDFAKLIFRPNSGSRKWGAERMWVKIDRVDGDALEGTLENEPEDMPDLHFGDPIRFRRTDVVDCLWERRAAPPPRPERHGRYGQCSRERVTPRRCWRRRHHRLDRSGDPLPRRFGLGWRGVAQAGERATHLVK